MNLKGQTKQICPADRKIYELRDRMNMIDSYPLICGSIMSKKIAEGIDSLVLDIKTGNGAFMYSMDMARNLGDLLKKIGIYDFFEYVAGHNTFEYCKPDPRHLTSVVEIMGGSLKKTIMIGDSEVDAKSAANASLPFVLLEDGYTNVKTTQMKYDHLIKNFIGLDSIIKNYL